MAEGDLDPGDYIAWPHVRALAVERFGIKHFRPGQRELIEAVLSGRDAIGILPTGAGKSLCFHLPSLFLRGTVIVVSPLIALMQDQHDRLEDAQIEAARLDSTVTDTAQREREQEIVEGSHDIVLVTPERLQNPEHLEPLCERDVALFVVDEAHCISQWGHDFRPAYLELRHVIEALGRPPILALTATAPPELIHDIADRLGMSNPLIVQTGSCGTRWPPLRVAPRLARCGFGKLLAGFDAQQRAERDRLQTMIRYAESGMCRMQFLREYFGEPAGDACHHCDNCAQPHSSRQTESVIKINHPRSSQPIVESEFRPGCQVKHKTFGSGAVLRTEEDQIVVDFVRHGEKRILASRLRLV